MEEHSPSSEPLRPINLALLLLASGELLPRQRARDQQADLSGMDLKRCVLEAVVDRDPEPDDLEAVLMEIVDTFGPPTGPTRSVAASLLEEWHTACVSPDWVAHLLGEATQLSLEGKRRGRRLSS
jgi:hypothetical protein